MEKNVLLFSLVSNNTQRVHVGIWYILRAQRRSHNILTLSLWDSATEILGCVVWVLEQMCEYSKYLGSRPQTQSETLSQRVHVGVWYILRAQRGSHIPTLRPKYIPYSYMDPLGFLSPGAILLGRLDLYIYFVSAARPGIIPGVMQQVLLQQACDNPYEPLHNPSCYVIFHVLFHLILHYWGVISLNPKR